MPRKVPPKPKRSSNWGAELLCDYVPEEPWEKATHARGRVLYEWLDGAGLTKGMHAGDKATARQVNRWAAGENPTVETLTDTLWIVAPQFNLCDVPEEAWVVQTRHYALKEAIDRGVQMVKDGMSPADAAQEVGCNETTLRKRVANGPRKREGPSRKWTREQAIDAARLFFSRRGFAPRSLDWDWTRAAAHNDGEIAKHLRQYRRDYPAMCAIYRLFPDGGLAKCNELAGLTAGDRAKPAQFWKMAA